MRFETIELGVPGPQGPEGPEGPEGPQGEAGLGLPTGVGEPGQFVKLTSVDPDVADWEDIAIDDVDGLQDALDARASLSHTHAWADITGEPTTLAGYGITDAAASVHTHAWADITGEPTTLAGYGITDAAPSSHVGAGGTAHANVVAAGAAGFMTGADKTRLDGLGTMSTQNANAVAITGGSATFTGLLTTNGQVAFPATQNASADANTLDDYEEGACTPAFTFSTPPTGLTYAVQTGRYTKIGRQVSVRLTLQLTNKGTGGAGSTTITGLPFSNVGEVAHFSMVINQMTFTAGWTFMAAQLSGGVITLYQQGSANSPNPLDWAGLANGSYIFMSGVYSV